MFKIRGFSNIRDLRQEVSQFCYDPGRQSLTISTLFELKLCIYTKINNNAKENMDHDTIDKFDSTSLLST